MVRKPRPSSFGMGDLYTYKTTVESRSEPGKFYTVSRTRDGRWICHCWPFLRTHKDCYHIKVAKARQNSAKKAAKKAAR